MLRRFFSLRSSFSQPLRPFRHAYRMQRKGEHTSIAVKEEESHETSLLSGTPPEGYMSHLRNIGISAHIDSGKTTLTERILYYTGRVKAIHDVKGKDGVGAKMDSMELEKERGITIQSAATYCQWGDYMMNIIDTPGHVDFTIEVERALRVLDGGILVLCGVSGVQSQSMTVDRQMNRYKVPKIAFINKLDRMGANPWKVVEDLRTVLKHNAAAVQLPIGAEDQLEGVADLIERKAYYHSGENGEHLIVKDIPAHMNELVEEKRLEMIERLANVDDVIAEYFLMEEDIPTDVLKQAIRRQTILRHFVPVFMGSAFKNKGVQPLLNGAMEYLPSPIDRQNMVLDQQNDELPEVVSCNPNGPLIALAFKLEDGRYGQLTYMRIYSGTLRRGDIVYNVSNMKRYKVPRLVKMHSNEMEEQEVGTAGDVIAMFGIECASMDTFTDSHETARYTMKSLHVPEPVMSLSIRTKDNKLSSNFTKALTRFMKEDPTFKLSTDKDSKETIMSGMGELHLQIYIERMKREYDIEVVTGAPQVNYRETIRKRAPFNYLHKKQSGGAGQFARVVGYIEPIEEEVEEEVDESEDGNKKQLCKDVLRTLAKRKEKKYDFVNEIVGNCIPPEYIVACEKGVEDAIAKGWLIGHPIERMRVVLQDGQTHVVDSSELAFRSAMVQAIRGAFKASNPAILEPIMDVTIEIPNEFVGTIIGDINRRRGMILDTQTSEFTTISCHVPLQNMFGFSTDLRSATQGKGEYSMEYYKHQLVIRDVQEKLIRKYTIEQEEKSKK